MVPRIGEMRAASFWSKVRKADGCWEWLASKTKGGYGVFHDGSKSTTAHRYAYQLLVEFVPADLEVDHVVCDNPGCVNPAHLAPTPPKLNNLRGNSAGARNARKTACVNGHPFNDANTCYSQGRRFCRLCMSRFNRKYRSQKRAALAAA